MLFKRLKGIFYLVFPITSFVMFPFIPGTTPAFLLCFVFFFSMPLFVQPTQYISFYKIVFAFLSILLLFLVLSEIGVFFSDTPSISALTLVKDDNPEKLFLRGTVFTQHLYFLAAVIAFAFMVVFFEKEDMKLVFWGIRLLMTYGFIEWGAYLLTGQQIDFLTNRTFDDGNVEGSFFQIMNIAGLELQRMKSLTGEPSMFAFTILPFWVLAIEYKRKTDIILTSMVLVLSISTTAAFGMFVYAMYKMFRAGLKTKITLLAITAVILVLLFAFFGDLIELIWQQLVVEKFSGESVSGQDRMGGFAASVDFWSKANLWIKMFGVGFGVVRSTDFFSTLLVNNGIIGIIFWLTLFFAPFVLVGAKRKTEMKKLFPAVLVIFASLFSSVPEYMYLNIWVTLGMTYHLLAEDLWVQDKKLLIA